MAYDDDFENMFDNIRKMMKNPFHGFFGEEDNFFSLTDNNDKQFEAIDKDTKKSKKGSPKSKSYSISYKFGTGMDHPEIKVEGDATEEEVNRFLQGVASNFGSTGISGDAMKLLKPKFEGTEDESEPSNPDGAKTPFMDMQETKDGAILTLEMPGIGEKDVKVDFKDYGLEVRAEGSHIKYRREITLEFKPKKDAKITANNGIVTIELKRA